MYEWLENGFVLENLFGDKDIFLNYEFGFTWWQQNRRSVISFQIPLDKPVYFKKFGELSTIRISIEIYHITDMQINIHSNHIVLDAFVYRELGQYYYEIEGCFGGELCFRCKFREARVGNIKPHDYRM